MTLDEYIAAQDRLCRRGVRSYHVGKWLTLGAIPVTLWSLSAAVLMVFAGIALLKYWGWCCGHSLTLMKRHLESR